MVVTRVSVTTASKPGRSVISQIVRCEQTFMIITGAMLPLLLLLLLL